MKAKLILTWLTAGLLLANKVSAQTPDSTLTERYLLDFVVPDMPAFKALNTNPSNILRPADAKKFAVSLSPFYSNGSAVIPKNFAVEFSPWKLASSKWTLQKYNDNQFTRFLYRSSFSIGAIEDSTKFPNKLAVGYRGSILSKRADIYFLAHSILSNMQATMVDYQNLTNYWVINVVNPPLGDRPTYYQNHKEEFGIFLSSLSNSLHVKPDPALQALYDKFISDIGAGTNLSTDELKKAVETFSAGVDKFIANYKEENWNASRIDFAIAWVGESSNEQLVKSRFSSLSSWVTWAIRAHKNGQILIGTNLIRPRSVDDKMMTKWSGNLRYYVGTQDFRGFTELQYKIEKNQLVEKSLLINFGTELRIGSKFWISASGGLNNYLAEKNAFNKLVSNIDLKYGFNDPNKK